LLSWNRDPTSDISATPISQSQQQQPSSDVTEGSNTVVPTNASPPRRSSRLHKSASYPLSNVQPWKGKTYFAPSSLLATAIDKVCGLTPSSACMLQTQIQGDIPLLATKNIFLPHQTHTICVKFFALRYLHNCEPYRLNIFESLHFT